MCLKSLIDSLKFSGTASVVKSKGSSGINEYVSSLFDQSLTWKDVAWLKSITNLPIIIKGVLSAATAIEAYEHGAAAIIVSNHGARQLDGVPATIDVLASIGMSLNIFDDHSICLPTLFHLSSICARF